MRGEHLRLVFFASTLERGGITEVTLRLVDALREIGVSVQLLTESVDEAMLSSSGEVTCVRRNEIGRYVRTFVNSGAVLVSTSGRDTLRLALLLRGASRGSVVHVQHVPVVLSGLPVRVNAMRAAAAALAFRLVRGVVVVSQGVGRDVLRWCRVPRDRVISVPNCIHAHRAPVKGVERLESQLLFVGRLHYQKNVERLIRAFSAVVLRFPTAVLRIIGDGPDRAALGSLVANLGLARSVVFDGWRDQQYIHAEFERSCAIVMTSRWEGLPTVLVEAAAAGLPFIALDCVAGPAELVVGEKGGVVVNYSDDSGFSAQMLRAVSDPLKFREQHFPDAGLVSRYDANNAAADFLRAIDRLRCVSVHAGYQ